MKILFATSSPSSIDKVSFELKEHDVFVVETGAEVFKALSEDNYTCFITEPSLVDIDIWKLSLFIKNNITHEKGNNLPVFVISDGQNYPSLLKFNYGLQTISLDELSNISVLIESYKTKDNKPTVLIVEDDKYIAKGMEVTLKNNFNVDVCHDEENAVKCWKNKRHDLVLLDLMLHGGSGEDVLSKIKLINSKQEIIIVSARTEIEMQEKYMLLGASDYLTKPFKPEGLTRVCRVVLTQAIMKHEIERREKELNYLANKLFDAINILEEGSYESATDLFYNIANSVSLSDKGDDFCLTNSLLS